MNWSSSPYAVTDAVSRTVAAAGATASSGLSQSYTADDHNAEQVDGMELN